ncbi:tumor necrosis factor receptor superfamily member 16-like [Saccostrea echinata]|uniref:tumor necrosis factor receptor superfamily member 16-like n=1 Tax=Saccostrea echinata TaxID=191078 RepID=UPI002A83CD75|nr:tumor necrosis factor receptor superfamily member 16-like [Saccostrea echinata]
MGYMYIILFSILICIMGSLSYEDCTSNSSSDISKCCSLCPPGHGEIEKCTNETDTKCQPCEHRKTFSSSKYDTLPCKKCKSCREMEREILPCNTTHDTVCGCPLDFYFAEEVKKCQLCDLCPYGWGAIVACSTDSNTICRKCENGTFSDVKSATSRCRPCSVCRPTQFTIMECTDEQDTMCLDKPTAFLTTKLTQQPPSKTIKEDEFDAIPIYCAALGAVVLGLLGYVFFKQYSRLKDKKRHQIHDPHDHVEYARASGGTDSGVCVDFTMQCKTYNELTKYKDLPISKRKCVEHQLVSRRGNPSDWRALAQILGYTSAKIDQLESCAGDSLHCCQMMLQTWSHSKRNTTVGILMKGLSHIGRHDIVKILQADLQVSKSDHKHVRIV